MKETTRHIILAAKNKYEKQGGIKAVVSKITGVEGKYLDKRAIIHWYRDACNDMNISKEKIIDSIIKKTQSFRKHEDSQDIIIEALRLQLTFLNVLDEKDHIILDLGKPDLFNDESIEIIGFPPNLTPRLINSKSIKEFIIPLQFTDRKNGFIKESGYIPVLKNNFIIKNEKINGIKSYMKKTSGNLIDMSRFLNYNDKIKIINYIKDNLKTIEKLFRKTNDKAFPITKNKMDIILENLSSDSNDN